MIQSTCDVSNAGFAHAEAPPHPDGPGMTRSAAPDMQDLLALAASLGRDPLVIQGPGGNISHKRDGVMWVKASGTWMMNAMAQPILVPVDLAAVLAGLKAGDPSCE